MTARFAHSPLVLVMFDIDQLQRINTSLGRGAGDAALKRVARLARIKVTEEEATRMTGELNGILGFVEQLDEVNIEGVEPLTSVVEQAMKKRADGVTDGNKSADITANAPASEDNFFMVPKVVE